jgi:zona occludens toxin (predicted ATPase)
MKAEEYATKNAKTPEEVFSLYHAFKAGEIKGENNKTPFMYLILILFLGIIFGMMLHTSFPSLMTK